MTAETLPDEYVPSSLRQFREAPKLPAVYGIGRKMGDKFDTLGLGFGPFERLEEALEEVGEPGDCVWRLHGGDPPDELLYEWGVGCWARAKQKG